MRKTSNTFNASNLKYLEDLIGKDIVRMFLRVSNKKNGKQVSENEQKAYDTINNCLTTMQKFGDNHWWTSNDLRIIGYYQLSTPILLVPFDKYHESVEFLLKRPVWTHELWNRKRLKEEAERAFNGSSNTEEEKAQTIVNSLANFDKPVIVVTKK